MSQKSTPGNDAGSPESFFRTITAPATSADNQPQDSLETEEPATEEIPEEQEESDDLSEQETEETEEEQSSEEETETDPDDPERKRFKYWQSKHDKAQAELSKAKADLEAFKAVPKEAVEVAKAILEYPDAVKVLEEYLSTGKKPAAPQMAGNSAREQLKTLKRPEAPTKPEDFDEDEAITDPRSESAKYFKAERQYERQLQEYLLKRDELRDLVEVEVENSRRQQEQAIAQQTQLRKELQAKHGIAAAEIDDFFAVVNSKPTTEDMVLYYKAKKGALKTVAQVSQKKQELEKKADLTKKNPPPPGTRSGGVQGKNDSNQFFTIRK